MVAMVFVCVMCGAALAQDDAPPAWALRPTGPETFEVLLHGAPVSTAVLAEASGDTTLTARLVEAQERAERRAWSAVAVGSSLMLGATLPLVVRTPGRVEAWRYAIDRGDYDDEALYRQDAALAAADLHRADRQNALAWRARATTSLLLLAGGGLTLAVAEGWRRSVHEELGRPDAWLSPGEAERLIDDLNEGLELRVGVSPAGVGLSGSF